MAGDNAEVIYRERVYYGPLMWVLVGGLTALFVVVFVGALVRGENAAAWYTGTVSLALLVLIVNFWRLSFVVTTEEVVFGFGLVRKRLKRSDITGCSPYTLEFRNYLGYGIRLGFDRTVAYNTRSGPGVKLEVRGRDRPYVVSVNDPAAVCRLLSRAPGDGSARDRHSAT